MNAPLYPGYVIEVDDESVGIVVRDDDSSYRFYAATRAFYSLEQRSFPNPHAAQRAAYAVAHAPRRKRRAA